MCGNDYCGWRDDTIDIQTICLLNSVNDDYSDEGIDWLIFISDTLFWF